MRQQIADVFEAERVESEQISQRRYKAEGLTSN
jgi:hypothetical protein